jgi:hypothetical protein
MPTGDLWGWKNKDAFFAKAPTLNVKSENGMKMQGLNLEIFRGINLLYSVLTRLKLKLRSVQPSESQRIKSRFRLRNAQKQPMQNIAGKKRARQEGMDSDYLFDSSSDCSLKNAIWASTTQRLSHLQLTWSQSDFPQIKYRFAIAEGWQRSVPSFDPLYSLEITNFKGRDQAGRF